MKLIVLLLATALVAAAAPNRYTEISRIAGGLGPGDGEQLADQLRALPRELPSDPGEARLALDDRIELYNAAERYYGNRVAAWQVLDRLLQEVTLHPPVPEAAESMTRLSGELRQAVERLLGETRGMRSGRLRDAQLEELHRAAAALKWAQLEICEIDIVHHDEIGSGRARLVALVAALRIKAARDGELEARFRDGAEVARRARARMDLQLTTRNWR